MATEYDLAKQLNALEKENKRLKVALDKVTEAGPMVPASELTLAKQNLAAAKRETIREIKQREQAELLADTLTSITSGNVHRPKWLSPPKRKGTRDAIVNLMVSDCHFDEIVDPDEVEGMNAYNREIAMMRLERTFKNTIELSRDYISGINYTGASLMLGGDMVSGAIHEELAETNAAYMPDTILHWVGPLADGIGMMADEFGRVDVGCVVGNHGRNTRKPRAKGRVRDNWDWLIYGLLAREFRNDDRVTFNIPDSADCTIKVYNTTYRLTHGDQFRGGSGIAGILSPLMIGDHRKRKRSMETKNPYDILCMGHWHNYAFFKNVLVNGSTKGMDEYAYVGNFDYQQAQQAFWLTTPEHGPILHMPILCEDRKAEQW